MSSTVPLFVRLLEVLLFFKALNVSFAFDIEAYAIAQREADINTTRLLTTTACKTGHSPFEVNSKFVTGEAPSSSSRRIVNSENWLSLLIGGMENRHTVQQYRAAAIVTALQCV